MPRVRRQREVISVSIPLELAAQLRERARRTRRAVSHLVEDALVDYLKQSSVDGRGGRERSP